ncbi:hypothetical protein KY308_01080 [Candidatus Woesearchaeota archaeon]|nr:hypothetical protein [Candidatus Woesearchaeota archaeon]
MAEGNPLENREDEVGLDDLVTGYLGGRHVTLVPVPPNLVPSLRKKGITLADAIKRAYKSESGSELKDIVKQIDNLHDECGEEKRNEFYGGVVKILVESLGALNAKIELNINSPQLPKKLENYSLKNYHWDISEEAAKNVAERGRTSIEDAKRKLRNLVVSAKENRNIPRPLEEPTEKVIKHDKPFGPKNFNEFYMFSTMMKPSKAETYVGTLEIYGIPKRVVESLKQNGEDPAETLTEILKEVADQLDTIIIGDRAMQNALSKYSTAVSERFGDEEFGKWIGEGKKIDDIKIPEKTEESVAKDQESTIGMFYMPDSKFEKKLEELKSYQTTWQNNFKGWGLPDIRELYEDFDTVEVSDMMTRAVIFLSTETSQEQMRDFFPLGPSTSVALGVVANYICSAAKGADNLDVVANTLLADIESKQKNGIYKIPKNVFGEVQRILKNMNSEGDSYRQGASAQTPDLAEAIVQVIGHIGNSPINDFGGVSGQKGTLEDAITLLETNNYSSQIIEMVENMFMDPVSIEQRYADKYHMPR